VTFVVCEPYCFGQEYRVPVGGLGGALIGQYRTAEQDRACRQQSRR